MNIFHSKIKEKRFCVVYRRELNQTAKMKLRNKCYEFFKKLILNLIKYYYKTLTSYYKIKFKILILNFINIHITDFIESWQF